MSDSEEVAVPSAASSAKNELLKLYGPTPNVEYPLKVQYCGECGMPLEYCEFGPCIDKCKAWLEKNLPDKFSQLNAGSAAEGGPAEGEEKKRQKRGGKSAAKPAKAKGKAAPQAVKLSRAPRGKNKFVTVISGLGSYEIDLKAASKFFAQRFACGSSVTGPDEIVVQGDVKDDLFDLIPEKWPQVDEDVIEDLGDLKRST